MKLLKLAESGIQACAEEAAAVLAQGGLVVYPTDTVYGLGADAFSDAAVEKVYACKGRDENKPIHVVVPDMQEAANYASVTPAAEKLARAFLPGPLTMVLLAAGEVRGGIMRGMNTIGIRIPHNEFCLALAKAYGRPFTTTSANRSGQPTETEIQNLLAQFDDAASHFDLVIDAGALPESKPSTVVDLTGPELVVLREGAIPEAKIREALRS